MDTTIGQISNNCVTKATLQGCANNVPYLMVVSDGCCDASTLTYINLEDGTISETRPTDFKLGECPSSDCPPIYETESFVATAGQTQFTLSHTPYVDVDFTRNGATLIDSVAVVTGNVVTYVPAENNNINLLANDDITISYLYKDTDCTPKTVDSVICFEFDENGTIVPIRVVSVNGSVTYYENDVLVTNSIRLAAIEAMVAAASSSNVVCCPCESTPNIPPYRTCYSPFLFANETITTWSTGPFLSVNNTLSAPRELQKVEVVADDGTGTNVCKEIVFATPIQLWAGANTPVNANVIFAALESENFFEQVKECIPCLDSWGLIWNIGATNSFFQIHMWNQAETCDDEIQDFYIRQRVTSNGVFVQNLDVYPFTNDIEIGGGANKAFYIPDYGTPLEVYYIDGEVRYFENGVKVTDSARIAELEAALGTATEYDIVCCDDCGGSEPEGKSDMPPYKVCYPKVPVGVIDYTDWRYIAFSMFSNEQLPEGGDRFPVGQSRSITGVYNGDTSAIPVTPNVTIWNGTSFLSAATIDSALRASNFLSQLQTLSPEINEFNIERNAAGTELTIRMWNTASPTITIPSGFMGVQLNVGSEFLESPSTGSWTVPDNSTLFNYSAFYDVNGKATYYLDGVEITDFAQIEIAKERIETAGVDAIGCCPDCEGETTAIQSGTGTTVTGTGTTEDPYIISSTGGGTSVLENVYFDTTDPNTAGTIFSPSTPQDTTKLYVSNVDGSTWIWNGTAYVSKTDNLGWQAIGRYGTLSVAGGQTITTGQTVIDMVSAPANQTFGSLVVPDPATNTLLLKAGYIYEVTSELQMEFSSNTTWMNYAIHTGTTAASQTTQIGNAGKVRPQSETTNARYDINASAFVRATVDTYVSLKRTNGNGTLVNFEGGAHFKAKVIGVI